MIHSNGSHRGSQRPGSPTPTSGASEQGEVVMGQVRCCHPLPCSPGEPGEWDTGDEGGRPSSLPSQPLQGVGKGSHLLCFRGRLKEGRPLAQSHRAQQELQPRNTGQPKDRAVTVGLCYSGGWKGNQLGNSQIPSHTIWMVNSQNPSPRLLPITAMGYLISRSIQCSLATSRLGCSICPSSNKGPCYQTQGGLGQGAGDMNHSSCLSSPPGIP